MGQTVKNSVRAYVFRVTPESGHSAVQSACRKRAKMRKADREPISSGLSLTTDIRSEHALRACFLLARVEPTVVRSLLPGFRFTMNRYATICSI
jgi:hypothetical protein